MERLLNKWVLEILRLAKTERRWTIKCSASNRIGQIPDYAGKNACLCFFFAIETLKLDIVIGAHEYSHQIYLGGPPGIYVQGAITLGTDTLDSD